MDKPAPPKLRKFPAAKQRRLDELLEQNSAGTISPAERNKLEQLVSEAETLMVANGKLLAWFSRQEAVIAPDNAVPVTVWITPDRAER